MPRGTSDEFERRISGKDARVAVIGLGYMGLPLARALVEAGIAVIGFDLDEAKLAKLRAGKSYIRQIPSETIRKMARKGRFVPTSRYEDLSSADAILICVPTPLTRHKEPDLRYVK